MTDVALPTDDPRDVALRACVEAMAAARPVMWSPSRRADVLRAELAAREVLEMSDAGATVSALTSGAHRAGHSSRQGGTPSE